MITNHKLQASLTNARFSPKPNNLIPEQRDQTSFLLMPLNKNYQPGSLKAFLGPHGQKRLDYVIPLG